MSPEAEKILAALEARRSIYLAKQEQASGDERPLDKRLNYDRHDLFKHAKDALEWAINEACQAIGEQPRYPDAD